MFSQNCGSSFPIFLHFMIFEMFLVELEQIRALGLELLKNELRSKSIAFHEIDEQFFV